MRKNILVVTILGILLGMFLVNTPAANAEEPLSFDLKFSKAAFKAGQAIPVTMVITNNGSMPLLVNKRFFAYSEDVHELYFSVKDCNGKEMPLKIEIKMKALEPKDFARLKPGRSFSGKTDLNHLYMLPPGTYTVVGTYENVYKIPGEQPWMGKIKSKSYKIYVE